MPRGAKTAKTCSLDTMKVEKTISIFKAKHIKGWWPFAVNTGKSYIVGAQRCFNVHLKLYGRYGR